jgi:hypothetical protein
MTAQAIDALGYVPIAGGSKPILHIVLRRKGEPYHGKRFLTWSHGNGEFVEPEELDQRDRDIIKKKLRKSIDK